MRKTIAACALTALAVGGGSATAATLITGKQIKDGSITNRDLRQGSISLNRLTPGTQSLIAKAGTPGPAGALGAAGVNGVNGASGAAGAKGDQGEDGATGLGIASNGQDGKDGAKGDKGDAGIQGRDGANGTNADGTQTVDAPVTAFGSSGFTNGSTVPAENTASFVDGALRLQNTGTGGFARLTRTDLTPFVRDISSLLYKFDVVARPAGAKTAPTLKITVVDADRTDNAASGFTTLVYEPTYSRDLISSGTVDTLGSGNQWWSTRAIEGAPTTSSYVSLQSLIAGNPNMKVTSISIETGESGTGLERWGAFDATVDFLTVGTGGGDPIRYDFGS